jgi:hypothetical protein
MKRVYNLDEKMINHSNEVLKPKHYTCFQRLLGWRVVNGCPRCTLCVNDLTPNLLWTKNLFVL